MRSWLCERSQGRRQSLACVMRFVEPSEAREVVDAAVGGIHDDRRGVDLWLFS